MIESDALRQMIDTLERAANERPGLGTALRALTAAASAEICDDDGMLEWNRVVEVIEQLGRALVATAIRTPPNDVDGRAKRVLIELVSITVGEGDDLARIVDLQSEAREILDASTH